MTKTAKDILYALIDDIAGDAECAKRIRAKLKRQLLKLKDDPRWKTVVSEKEYAGTKKRIRTNLPALLRQLERIGQAPARSAGR